MSPRKRLPPGTGTIKQERGQFVALLPRHLSRPPPFCKRPDDYRQRLGAFPTWEEAAGVLVAAAEQLRKNPVALGGRSFAEASQRTIERIHSDALRRYRSEAQANRRVSTERSMCRHWLEREPWWHLPVETIETRDLQTTLDQILRTGRTHKGGPVSTAFVRGIARFLRSVFEDAGLETNPAKAVKLPKKKAPAVPWWPLSSQLSFFRSDEIPEEGRVMAGCGMGAGLRVNELLSLQVDDLHLDASDPHLIVRHGGPDHGPTKGDRVRTVELFEPGLGFFRLWMRSYYRETPSRLVFAGPLGGYQRHWPENFPTWAKACGLRHATSHIMRHTYAVSLLSGTWGYEPQGLDFLKDQLGHADLATTERYYGAYEQETWRRQVRRMTGQIERPRAHDVVTAEALLGRTMERNAPEVLTPTQVASDSRHPPHASFGRSGRLLVCRVGEDLMTQAALSLSAAAVCLFALSCSEGPGAISQGGAQFTTGSTPSAPDGTRCPTPGYTVSIGDPAPDLNSDAPGRTIADGVDGTRVSCRVRGSDTVTFSGSIRGANTTDGRTAELRLDDGTIEANGTGTVTVSVSTPISSAAAGSVQLTSQEPCTITGVETSGGKQYGDGILWARFLCSGMVTSGQPSNYCRTEGVLVFENCE